MAATPKNGLLTFVGLQSGKTYSKDVYVSDVVAGLVNWDAGAGASASSPEDWPATEGVTLVDAAIVTGMADTTKLQLTRNGVPTGDIIRYEVYLTSLNNRPALNIPFNALDKIAAIQLA